MQQVATISPEALPALIDRAAKALESARTSGEVLEARDIARTVYDAAKSAARIARAKDAHDDIIAAVYRAQGDAARIEARAKIRLADEYDAAQARGEVAKHGGERSNVTDGNVALPTAADIGLSRKDIYEARILRDAETAEPGVIDTVIDERVAMGEEPTKAAIRSAAEQATGKHNHRAQGTGVNEWYTPSLYIMAAREVMGSIDLDPATSDHANSVVDAESIFTIDEDGLEQKWFGNVWMNPPYSQPAISLFSEKLASEWESGRLNAAIALTHNYTDTAWFHRLAHACTAICFTRGRISFESPDGRKGSPTQGQAFFYFGQDVERFHEVFDDIGIVVEVRQ